MGVQNFATKRNTTVEFLIDFVLQKFSSQLFNAGLIAKPEEPILQKTFQRDDCSDVIDHFITLELLKPIKGVIGTLQIWGQTTSYKGNKTGKPESNKTYEIRETLIEALGLRRWLLDEDVLFRTIHFTLGPANYTYGWFKPAKDNAFDLSIYPDSSIDIDELLGELEALSDGMYAEFELYEKLEEATNISDSITGRFINTIVNRLYEWFTGGFPKSLVADKQALLMKSLRQRQNASLIYALDKSKNGGIDIKGRVFNLLSGHNSEEDKVIGQTVKRLNLANPFLEVAAEAINNWHAWSKANFNIPHDCNNLEKYISYLWDSDDPSKLIKRRLLLRVHTQESILYVQDLDIVGISEHNLYAGKYPELQIQKIVARIISNYTVSGIYSPEDLYQILVSNRGKQLINDSIKFERVNGTNIKPSFFYVEEALKDDYVFTSFPIAGLPQPIGYHKAFGADTVKPYTNLKVVCVKETGKPIAIIKAKYFRKQEFPRRAKEEAYVGITTKFNYIDGNFIEHYPGIPLIMFVDMDTELCPPEYAITRLVTSGWEVFFTIEELEKYLNSLKGNSS
jgi:uncharacterized protein (DUF2147 family)